MMSSTQPPPKKANQTKQICNVNDLTYTINKRKHFAVLCSTKIENVQLIEKLNSSKKKIE